MSDARRFQDACAENPHDTSVGFPWRFLAARLARDAGPAGQPNASSFHRHDCSASPSVGGAGGPLSGFLRNGADKTLSLQLRPARSAAKEFASPAARRRTPPARREVLMRRREFVVNLGLAQRLAWRHRERCIVIIDRARAKVRRKARPLLTKSKRAPANMLVRSAMVLSSGRAAQGSGSSSFPGVGASVRAPIPRR